ncbi:hypothetical protein [Sphingobacterium sp. UME9]|uniref:hypothetical protein n=1 Tax=Sphingobacterium TaxID=28453 RepID=UPI001600F48B|nr:hypothetical protein [Sphingobacterium sp. UME9]MBB1642733.1 hypothetical protein [Sphingobacterium sp. UME9]
MKRKNLMAAAVMVFIAVVAVLSCNKQKQNDFGDMNGTAGKKAKAVAVSCPPIVFSGTISTPTTLLAGNAYLLRGNVVVNNTTLTIQPGVVIQGEKATNGALIVLPNASINATGTSSNPIIFTSNQNPGSRAAGDWAGVYLLGNAPNNQGNALAIQINGASFTAGGSSAASSVGTFKYVQIHFAGKGGGSGSDRRSESSLVLASLGSASTLDHIQISNSGFDGVGVFGGAVNLKNIVSMKTKRSDFVMSYGYTGRSQYLSGLKQNTLSPAASAKGMEIKNVLLNESFTASPRTYPTISNTTLMGGNYCGQGNNNIEDGIFVAANGSAKIYNSVITSFNQHGLNLANDVIANTATGTFQLRFSFNSMQSFATATDFRAITNLAWTSNSGCGASMVSWIAGSGLGCQQIGNQFSADISTLGYNSSFCGDFCGSGFTPNFTLGLTDLENSDFTWDSAGQFEHPAYRGAYGAASWVNGWVDMCPLNTNYCV